ncbi:MAG: hypothetical protein N3A71_00690 [Candidatus Dojkabacteria bacterium]|nr:hypothetical protein [Candidatus Dojkabacteria bacterium]
MGKIVFEDQEIYSKLKKYSKTKKGHIITDTNYNFSQPDRYQSRIIVHNPKYYLRYLKNKEEKLFQLKEKIPKTFPYNLYHDLIQRIITNIGINILNIEYLTKYITFDDYIIKNKELHESLYPRLPQKLKNIFVSEWIQILKIIHEFTKIDIDKKYLSYDLYKTDEIGNIKVLINPECILLAQKSFLTSREFSGQHIKQLIKQKMRDLGIPRKRYKFIFTEKHNLSVNSLRRSIRIPKIYHSNDFNLQKTIEHEVQGHIYRAYKSTRTKINNSYFRINGLITSYEEFLVEEGIATYVEDKVLEQYISEYLINIKYYLRIIALILAENYPVYFVYEYLENIKQFLNKARILNKTKNSTNQLLHRIYRGFALAQPGFINNKINIYLFGNKVVREYISNQDELEKLFESRRLNSEISIIIKNYKQ